VTVLLISGSLRQGSANTALLRTIQQITSDSHATVLYDGLADLPHFNPDLDHDPLPPPVGRLRAAIREADAILFCTPEYAGALPGSFKNLLDWTIGDENPGSIYRKPVAWINVSASPTGAADAHQSLAKVLGYAHADLITQACAHIPVTRHAIGDDGRISNQTIRGDALNALGLLSTTAAQRNQDRQA
jgi:chromate reductase, NAD(P)H dehydrogenase (quinone)